MKFHSVLLFLIFIGYQTIAYGSHALTIQKTFNDHKFIIGTLIATGVVGAVGYSVWKYSSSSKKNSKKNKESKAFSFFSNNNFSSVYNTNTNSGNKQYQSQKSRRKELSKEEPINRIPALDKNNVPAYNNLEDFKVSDNRIQTYENIVRKLREDKNNMDSGIYLEKLKKIYKPTMHNFLDKLVNIVFDQKNEYSASNKKSFIDTYNQDLHTFENTFTTAHSNNNSTIIEPINLLLQTLKEDHKKDCNYLLEALATECNSIDQDFLEMVIQMVSNNPKAQVLEEFLENKDNEKNSKNLAKALETFLLECPVCYNLLNANNRTKVCLNFHQICNTCLIKLSKSEETKCPQCRSPFDLDIINSEKR